MKPISFPTPRTCLLVAAGAGLVFGSTIAVAAASSPGESIEQRQTNYKRMGTALKMLKDELASDTPSARKIQAAAKLLDATAKLQPYLFPAGSGPSSGIKTDALPNIWTERADFDAAMKNLIAQSSKLVTVADGGSKADITAQYRETGKTCGACHRQFRKD